MQFDAIIKLRYGQLVTDANHTSFVTYDKLGRLFKCSPSKIRQLIQTRFEQCQR